jgi:metallo-beta-lactamase family protein
MKLSFHGAAQGVTGSCHLLQAGGLAVLVDCGLYQGSREIAEENSAPFGFDPAAVDCLLLTHAHLDHCGRIPMLVKQGFRGEILCTAATRELARLILLDSAHIQEEEAKRAARRARRRGDPAPEPLYTVEETLWSFERFGRTAAYGETIALNGRVSVRFIDAGHIVGAAALVLEAAEEGAPRRLVFSGDVGGAGHPIVRDPQPAPQADYVVMESTYGDRLHRPLEESVEELYSAILDTFSRGGNVVIPTFALERTQEILFFLREGIRRERLPAGIPVFLDSPMAISATDVMRRHPECFDSETLALLEGGTDPFALPNLHFTREPAESMALNRITGGAVIMAGSGMCTGGRVRHHLRHNLWREQSGIVFVGYAAPGTLAREIIDGARSVEIFEEPVRVRARVHTINGFSAHADQGELLGWHGHTGQPKATFLVHGDPERGMAGLAAALAARGQRVLLPRRHDCAILDDHPRLSSATPSTSLN